jgi:hypothetical protein
MGAIRTLDYSVGQDWRIEGELKREAAGTAEERGARRGVM